MDLSVCVLASGSSANCIHVEAGETRLLIDAGLSCRETTRRLAEIGVDIETIAAVCVTHEHDDHRSGLGVLQRRHNVALYGNAGTADAVDRGAGKPLTWRIFTNGVPFQVGDLVLEPFSVPHDSYDPVGFVIRSGETALGIVTDIGMPTGLVRERLSDCSVVILEANHDEYLLRDAPRPWSLKQRIAGRQGHLSNTQAGQLLVDIAGRRLHTAFLAHISRDCNRPELAIGTVQRCFRESGKPPIELKLTYADRVSERVKC